MLHSRAGLLSQGGFIQETRPFLACAHPNAMVVILFLVVILDPVGVCVLCISLIEVLLLMLLVLLLLKLLLLLQLLLLLRICCLVWHWHALS